MDIWPAAAQRVHAIRSTKRRKRWDVAEANPKASRPVGTVLAWTRWQCQFSLLHCPIAGIIWAPCRGRRQYTVLTGARSFNPTRMFFSRSKRGIDFQTSPLPPAHPKNAKVYPNLAFRVKYLFQVIPEYF